MLAPSAEKTAYSEKSALTLEEISDRIATLIVSNLEPDCRITELNLDDNLITGRANLNSFSLIELVVMLEREYDIVLDDQLFLEHVSTVRSLATLVYSKLLPKSAELPIDPYLRPMTLGRTKSILIITPPLPSDMA